MRFDLKEVYNFYDGFWAIGRWSPLVVVVSYILAKLIHYPILHRLQQVGLPLIVYRVEEVTMCRSTSSHVVRSFPSCCMCLW